MVYRRVQLVSPADQEMQESKRTPPADPPQTTRLPPDRRDTVWSLLGSGRSGMEQGKELGRGNSSTLESETGSPKELI